VKTSEPPVFGPTITHENFVITLDSGDLDTARIRAAFSIAAAGPPFNPAPYGLVPPFDTVLGPLSLDFDIDFEETPNHPAGGACLGGGTDGAGINDNGCADIFVLTGGGTSIMFPYPDPDGGFNVYTASIALPGLEVLPPAACTAVGLGAGCRGFRTREDDTNVFGPGIEIHLKPIPEPATLVLLGLGIVGLAAGVRFRRK